MNKFFRKVTGFGQQADYPGKLKKIKKLQFFACNIKKYLI
jgi:hypothetical protein